MNQTLVLQKCVDELNGTEPRLDYVRGMLDTLLALTTLEITPTTQPSEPLAVIKTPNVEEPDEAAMLDAQTRSMLGQIDTTIHLEQ